MLTLRQIDYWLQFLLAFIMLLCIPTVIISMAGLFIMGWWQLISAGLNTRALIHNGLKKQIRRYWLWTSIVLGTLFLCTPLSNVFDPDDVQVLAGIAIAGSAVLAVYYLRIYFKLIEVMTLKENSAD